MFCVQFRCTLRTSYSLFLHRYRGGNPSQQILEGKVTDRNSADVKIRILSFLFPYSQDVSCFSGSESSQFAWFGSEKL